MMEQRNLLLAIVFRWRSCWATSSCSSSRASSASGRRSRPPRRSAGRRARPSRRPGPRPAAGGAGQRRGAPRVPGATVGLPPAPGVAPSAAAGRDRAQGADRLQPAQGLALAQGRRIDDLLLTDYRETIEDDSARITLFSPPGRGRPIRAVRLGGDGYRRRHTDAGDGVDQPERHARAGAPARALVEQRRRLAFTQEITLDRDYMFKVTQRVTNRGERSVGLRPYGLIAHRRAGYAGLLDPARGLLGVFGDTLKEVDYDDVSDADNGMIAQNSTGGWIGITDKYWLAALVPDQETAIASRFVHTLQDRDDKYQVDVLGPQLVVQPARRSR